MLGPVTGATAVRGTLGGAGCWAGPRPGREGRSLIGLVWSTSVGVFLIPLECPGLPAVLRVLRLRVISFICRE